MIQKIKSHIVYFGLRLGSRKPIFKHDKEYLISKKTTNSCSSWAKADFLKTPLSEVILLANYMFLNLNLFSKFDL
jgi:hypothetical protein